MHEQMTQKPPCARDFIWLKSEAVIFGRNMAVVAVDAAVVLAAPVEQGRSRMKEKKVRRAYPANSRFLTAVLPKK